MKLFLNLSAIIILNTSLSYTQEIKKPLFTDSISSESIIYTADSVIVGSALSIPDFIQKMKSSPLEDYFIIYRASKEQGWLVELNPQKFASIMNTAGWQRASVGIGGITVQKKNYPDKKKVLMLFK